jgi:very-short-patch-repair endonuclease
MDNRSMFYNAKPHIFEKANDLRKNLTEAEKILWFYLKKNKILGFRLKAQHPIERFIADFYCHNLKLVIEIDGGIHE